MRIKVSKERRKRIFFAKGMCLAIVLLMSLLLLYGFAIDNVKNTNIKSVEKLKTERFEAIYTYILELQSDAYESARDASSELEIRMRSMDQYTLKEELESGNISNELDSIFHEYTDKEFNSVENSRNGFIIANLKGILYDSNYQRVSGRNSRTWGSEVENSYNGELEQEAISRLLNRSESLIITESVNLLSKKYENHTKISTASYDTLLNMYLNEGIEGFRNYQVLCPAYITNNGDIFGQKDIVHGIKMDNNKIIVIQEFNIYDQLHHNKMNLVDDTNIQSVIESYSADLSLLYIIAFCFIAFIIVLLIYFSNSYNSYIDKYNLENEENLCDKNKLQEEDDNIP